ncbi:hypothetical protein SDC9_208728 [bioreactor metagenome]|uniref:Uncharacterized protein n=1 Tax=bioreactor metagenome TaxID=1076179 RepID=A0A645JKZ7_9ZZZZ
MADRRVGLHRGEPFLGESEPRGVLAFGGEEAAGHPLALHPQHHHDVGLAEHRVQVVADLAAPVLHPGGQQGRGRDQHDLTPEGVLQQHVAAHDPRVQQVADDRDLLSGEALGADRTEVLAHRQGVE